MQTYSHVLITTSLLKASRWLAKRYPKLPPVRSGALIVGSFAPDLILILVTIGCLIADMAQGVDFRTFGPESDLSTTFTGRLFEDWFFTSPWIISGQNLLHSPLMVAILIFIGFRAWHAKKHWGAWLFYFGCACMLHTLIDIPLHHDDGPLLLFPLNWSLRFYSPISYWDPRYYGTQFFVFEHMLDLLLIGYLIVSYRRNLSYAIRRIFRRKTPNTP